MRLMNTLLTTKETKLQETKDAWDTDLQILEETRVEIARLEDNLRRELDSKKRVETMLRSYKDEVETLNEALKIAALDIAQVGTWDLGKNFLPPARLPPAFPKPPAPPNQSPVSSS